MSKYSNAQKIQKTIVDAADKWVSWSDDELHALITTAQVPRAFELNPKGCPVHGAEVFNKGGTYPWIVNPQQPFHVQCPVGNEIYPSNDYENYYKSNFTQKNQWDTEYVDDGWGYVAPNGERYWFVAYANHWTWRNHIMPAILNLSRAYLLTGKQEYAHKASILLYRMAEVYPAMNHENQSRYGLMQKAVNVRYPGKILNNTWEAFFAKEFAQAYEAVWDSIDDNRHLQQFYKKNGKQIRSFIEANLLEDAIDAYFNQQLDGNYGMHQNALLHLLLVRQNLDKEKYFSLLVDAPGASRVDMGLRYALYNQIWRDGLPPESPSYNMLWLRNISELAELLRLGNYQLFEDPKMKLLYDSPLLFTVIGKHTPNWGDSGAVRGGLVGREANLYNVGYNAYRDPNYLTWLASANLNGENAFTDFNSLFFAPLPSQEKLNDARAIKESPTRLLSGSGFGLLNNPADTTGIALTFGLHVFHFHWDFLNFELFANGQNMMPDTGYPDAADGYIEPRFTWTNNTIAHNTVVVDQQKQNTNQPGTLHDFSNASFARSVDVSARAYSQTQQYRRHMVMVDVDETQSYLVDVFRVAGGTQHDYSLHGPPGVFTPSGEWSATAPGTLAGENVKLAQIYDDETLGKAGYRGVFTGYKGSGFQHLFNIQTLLQGKPTVQYQHYLDDNARLRIHLVPQENQKVFVADAYDLPRRKSHVLKYLIARRNAEADVPLKSTFISILEPFNQHASIESYQVLDTNAQDAVALSVKRHNATDIIISDTTNQLKTITAYGLSTDAQSAVVTFDEAGNLARVFFSGGSFLKIRDQQFTAEGIKGVLSKVDYQKKQWTVKLAEPHQTGKNGIAGLNDRTVHIQNEHARDHYQIKQSSIDDRDFNFETNDALLVGKLHVTSHTGNEFITDTQMPFASTYIGGVVLDSEFRPLGRIVSISGNRVRLSQALAPAASIKDVWVGSVGPGDSVTLNSLFEWNRLQTP